MVASRGFWGETEYKLDEAVFDEVQDNKTPVWLGASVEVGKAGDSEMKSNTSRLVVVGNGNVIDPVSQDKVSADFAMAALNWVINRESTHTEFRHDSLPNLLSALHRPRLNCYKL